MDDRFKRMNVALQASYFHIGKVADLEVGDAAHLDVSQQLAAIRRNICNSNVIQHWTRALTTVHHFTG